MSIASPPSSRGKGAPEDVRFIGDLSGCYVLSSREAPGDDRTKVFGCRSRSISPHRVVLQAPVKGAIGESLALKLDTLSILKAVIVQSTTDGFIADLIVADADRPALARRIDWLKRRQLFDLPERRLAKRWLPRDSHSSLLLAGRPALDCFIIDVSTTGASVSADVRPTLGQPAAVGRLVGRVVRQLEYGFAIAFGQVQDAGRVESLLTPPATADRDRLAALLAAAGQPPAAAAAAVTPPESPESR